MLDYKKTLEEQMRQNVEKIRKLSTADKNHEEFPFYNLIHFNQLQKNTEKYKVDYKEEMEKKIRIKNELKENKLKEANELDKSVKGNLNF